MGETGGSGNVPHSRDVIIGEFLDAGIRAQRPDFSLHVDHGLVERVAQRIGRITADQDGAWP